MIGLGHWEGYQIQTKTYNGSNAQDIVKKNGYEIPVISIDGERSKEMDRAVFEEISTYCNDTTTKLVLKFLDVDIEHIPTFNNLTELIICNCKLNYSFVKFDIWCPKLAKLEINNIDLGNDDWYDEWLTLSRNHKSVLLRNLSWDVCIETNEDVYSLFELMESQFPFLENLFLDFGSETNFTSGRTILSRFLSSDGRLSNDDINYEAKYFNNLKKLQIFAYGQCEEIFNFLKISNKKITEIEFCGMNADETLIKSISNYPKLTKLKFGCPYVEEEELHQLSTHLTKLMNLTLDTKYFDWEPSNMIKFIEDSKRLRRLTVTVDRKNKKYRIDDAFKNKFLMLVQNGRRFLQLHITFFQSSQEIKLSKSCMIDNMGEPDSENSEDDL